MEFLQNLLDLFRQFIWAFTNGLASILQGLTSSMSRMSDAQAQVCASSLLVIGFGAWVVRKVNWLKMKIFQPQTITLRTDKTPWQVLADDMRGCLFSVFLVIVLAAIVYSLVMGP